MCDDMKLVWEGIMQHIDTDSEIEDDDADRESGTDSKDSGYDCSACSYSSCSVLIDSREMRSEGSSVEDITCEMSLGVEDLDENSDLESLGDSSTETRE